MASGQSKKNYLMCIILFDCVKQRSNPFTQFQFIFPVSKLCVTYQQKLNIYNKYILGMGASSVPIPIYTQEDSSQSIVTPFPALDPIKSPLHSLEAFTNHHMSFY